MEILEGLLTRRSIRRYKKQDISDSQLELLIKAGMYAPSAVNKQPWHFIIFRDKKTIDRITDFHQNAAMLKDASAAILICWDEKLQHDEGYGPVDCSAATQNILLAAHGSGMGSVWVGIYPREQRMRAVHELFQLPENIQPFSIISVGFPDEEKKQPDRFKQERIHYETW
jgi:nitroreductase